MPAKLVAIRCESNGQNELLSVAVGGGKLVIAHKTHNLKALNKRLDNS